MDVRKFAEELRKWWSFDGRQMHTHSWHDREDFIRDKLPALLDDGQKAALSKKELELIAIDCEDSGIELENKAGSQSTPNSRALLSVAFRIRHAIKLLNK